MTMLRDGLLEGRAVAIAPGGPTTDDEVAELVCFLVSPAGEYLSGCVFELGALIRSS